MRKARTPTRRTQDKACELCIILRTLRLEPGHQPEREAVCLPENNNNNKNKWKERGGLTDSESVIFEKCSAGRNPQTTCKPWHS
ncbi:hypothetical protein ACRRTK_011745 [Alexandromys fortis]